MILQEGPGWRLARDPSRGEFSILVGGEGWAFELTEPEWNDLVALLSTLETPLGVEESAHGRGGHRT